MFYACSLKESEKISCALKILLSFIYLFIYLEKACVIYNLFIKGNTLIAWFTIGSMKKNRSCKQRRGSRWNAASMPYKAYELINFLRFQESSITFLAVRAVENYFLSFAFLRNKAQSFYPNANRTHKTHQRRSPDLNSTLSKVYTPSGMKHIRRMGVAHPPQP